MSDKIDQQQDDRDSALLGMDIPEPDNLRATLEEVVFGLQNYLEEHGDAGGLVEILAQAREALGSDNCQSV